MRINILLPHLKLSGGVSVSTTFAHELAIRGHDVFLVVESKSVTRYVRNLTSCHPLLPKNSSVKIKHVKHFSDLPRKGMFIADSWQVAKKLSEMNVVGEKFHYIQHDERMYHGDPEEVERVYRLPLIKLVNATWLQETFRDELNIETTLLFNSIDCELFNPNRRNRKANDTSIRVIVLHHDYGWKGTKDGVAIVERLKKKYPAKKIKLILFGTREKRIEYPCDEYHYNIVGSDLATLFANSDIYIGSSRDDSRAILHRWIMASGCSMSLYDNVSVDDYIEDKENALLAHKGDVEDLYKKTEDLVVDEILRKRIAGNAVSYVRKLPTWTELTDILEKLLKSHA